MKKMKKMIAVILMLVLCLGMSNLSVFAAEGDIVDNTGSVIVEEADNNTPDNTGTPAEGTVGDDNSQDNDLQQPGEGSDQQGTSDEKGDQPSTDPQPVEGDDQENTDQPPVEADNPEDAGVNGDEDPEEPEEPEVNYAASIGKENYETLQEAIDAAQSDDTIVLTQDFIPTGDEQRGNDWLNMVTASKTPKLTIDLNGYTVDCKNQFGWLHVNNNTTMDLTVKNGTIQNAGNCSQGSAIWAFGTLTLENMTIKDCNCTSFGGAVFVGGSHGDANLTVTGCTFTGNSARDGGAIWAAEAQKVDISNTTFTKNTAKSIGGAVYVNGDWESPTAVVTLNSCTFEENTALAGGAVSSYDNCNLTVSGCTFTSNHADERSGSGGAIYATGNQAANMPGTLTVNGNTTFNGNTAAHGGAIFAKYLYPSKLENVTFTGNHAKVAYGGAAYCYAVQMTLNNVTATSNTSGNLGGAFFLQLAPAAVTNSNITYNTAGYGGGLYCTQSDVTVSSSTITENTAAYGGGVTNYFGKLTLSDGAKVYNNIASSLGDDIYCSDAGYHETYPASLELVVAENAVLKSDGKTITGWYVDGQEGEATTTNRWGVEGFYKTFDGTNSVVALKAAHGIYHTVTYVDGVADSEVFADQRFEVAAGSETPAFNGTPTREGFTFTGWSPAVADTVTGDVTYTAQWRSNGGGGTYVPTPTPDEPDTPSVDIDDPDTPLSPGPDEPDVEIDEPDTPLAPAPDEPAIEIDEEDVPLSDVPKTGDNTGILGWEILMILSGTGLAWLALTDRKRKNAVK